MPLAFFGSADFSLESLQFLMSGNYDIAIVITQPDRPGKRGKHLQPPAVKQFAQDHGIPVLQPANRSELASKLTEYPHLTWGVVAAYGMIIPPSVIDYFHGQIVNVHASRLPRWRGPSPIESAIYYGDETTGNSLMQLTPAMDAGPIYIQSEHPITTETTRLELYEYLRRDGARLLIEHLPDIMKGELQPFPQDESRATYSRILHKSDGEIDWQQPARDVDRHIRAFLGWPGSVTTIAGVRVTIESVRVVDRSGAPGTYETDHGSLIIYCLEQALRIERLKPAGRNTISGEEFVRGYMF